MEPTKENAIDSRPVRLWEVVRLSAWVLAFTLRSAADLLDHPDSRRA